MPNIMNRSLAEHLGVKWPKEIARLVDGKPVTFAELRAERKVWQAERLRRACALHGAVREAAYVWTFYQPGLFGFAYVGWHLYLRTLRHHWWLDIRDGINDGLTLELMRMFPCGLLSIPENFYRWKEAFGSTYSRPGRFKQQGLVPGWVDCKWDGAYSERFTPA